MKALLTRFLWMCLFVSSALLVAGLTVGLWAHLQDLWRVAPVKAIAVAAVIVAGVSALSLRWTRNW